MKRHGNLFPQIIAWPNLIDAAMKAMKGKRSRPSTIRFDARLFDELSSIKRELEEGRYKPGPYASFRVYEKKPRLISAAPFRDRVVHHALCNVIMPLFEARYVDQSFANRVGKGTHRAIALCQRYLKEHPWYLKCDVVKYFPSIDHEILKKALEGLIKCNRTLELASVIIDGSNPQDPADFYFPGDDLFTPFARRKGLPIGNLTSQHFANIYLTPLDRYILRDLGVKAYIRYVDDFLVFGESAAALNAIKPAIIGCAASLRLRLHTERMHPRKSDHGVGFLGHRVFPGHVGPSRDNAIRARRKAARTRSLYESFAITEASFMASMRALEGAWGRRFA